MRRTSQAFTLIELLVVVAIIAVLISILLPAVKHSKQIAMSAKCQSSLRQWHLATVLYVEDFDGIAPFPTDQQTNPSGWGDDWHQDHRIAYYFRASQVDKMCPNFQGENPSDQQYVGYLPNGWVAGRWRYPNRDQRVRWHEITSVAHTPWMIDANGAEIANPYSNRGGMDLSSPWMHYWCAKFRHLNTINMVMVDGHMETARGKWVGEWTFLIPGLGVPGVTLDDPERDEEFFGENQPYVWHSYDAPADEYPRGFAVQPESEYP